MLSFSLRRKSAPGSLNVRDGGNPSPSRRQGTPIPSISSKKSLSSLFSISQRDASPKTSRASDEVGIVEKAHYPLYDAANPDHNHEARTATSTHSKTSKCRSRSSLQIRSSSGPRSFLDTIASKMRAATEFFHRASDVRRPESDEPESLSPARSVSPRKSVRFRSGTYTHGESNSSPIDVPRRSAPTLPHLELPKAPFIDSFAHVAGDPIPTGRPPDTPVLKAKEGDGYFPGPPGPRKIMELNKAMQQADSPVSNTMPAIDSPAENAFEDNAAIHDLDKSDEQGITKSAGQHQHNPFSSNATTSKSESSTEEKFALTRVNTERTSTTSYLNEATMKAERKEELDTPKPTNTANTCPASTTSPAAEVNAVYRPPSAQVSFAIIHSSTQTKETKEKPNERVTDTTAESVWTLESRRREKETSDDHTSDSEDLDFRYSPSVSSRRLTRRRPTHEEIRRQFRSFRERHVPSLGERSSSSPGSAGERCEASIAEVPNDMATQIGTKVQNVAVTDPTKPLPQATPTKSPPDEGVIVPEDTVSPLNLKASVSSTSPSRTRRPFRFSNSTDKDSQATPIGNATFSWHAKKAGEETSEYKHLGQNQTPSPVSIPLPLSIPPKKLPFDVLQPYARYIDQHGWSPFHEKHFTDVILTASHLHHLLVNEGGFAAFWEEAGLPHSSRPSPDTDSLSDQQVANVLETARRIRGYEALPGLAKQTSTPNVMDQLFSPWVASDANKFSPLALHRQEYSGEVSTADLCSEAGPPCSDSGCKMCLTRESYESSTNRSAYGSIPSGYESDMEEEPSDKENLRPAGNQTPTRMVRSNIGDKTPKQTDFGKFHGQPLTRQNTKYLRGDSEASETTISTVGYMSEDEKFARGIV